MCRILARRALFLVLAALMAGCVDSGRETRPPHDCDASILVLEGSEGYSPAGPDQCQGLYQRSGDELKARIHLAAFIDYSNSFYPLESLIEDMNRSLDSGFSGGVSVFWEPQVGVTHLEALYLGSEIELLLESIDPQAAPVLDTEETGYRIDSFRPALDHSYTWSFPGSVSKFLDFPGSLSMRASVASEGGEKFFVPLSLEPESPFWWTGEAPTPDEFYRVFLLGFVHPKDLDRLGFLLSWLGPDGKQEPVIVFQEQSAEISPDGWEFLTFALKDQEGIFVLEVLGETGEEVLSQKFQLRVPERTEERREEILAGLLRRELEASQSSVYERAARLNEIAATEGRLPLSSVRDFIEFSKREAMLSLPADATYLSALKEHVDREFEEIKQSAERIGPAAWISPSPRFALPMPGNTVVMAVAGDDSQATSTEYLEESEWAAIWARIRLLYARLLDISSNLRVDMRMTSSPTGAAILIRPVSFEQGGIQVTTDDKRSGIYRGIYEFQVSLNGFKSFGSEINLVDDRGEVLHCILAEKGIENADTVCRFE